MEYWGKEETNREQKMMTKKRVIGFIFIFIFAFVFAYYKSILRMAAEFMAPENLEVAETIIIESSEIVRENAVKMGIDLILKKKANSLVLVYQNSHDEKVFGRPSDYAAFLAEKLENWGLKREQILIVEVPKEHPVTLAEARIVLQKLARKKVKKAILLAEGFHTRRSFWTYKRVGEELDIKIFPLPCFLKYRKETWWQDNQGIREFFAESIKYLYYLIRGYIPIKSLVMM